MNIHHLIIMIFHQMNKLIGKKILKYKILKKKIHSVNIFIGNWRLLVVFWY